MNLYYSLLLVVINCYSLVVSIDTPDKYSLIIGHGQRSIKDDHIIGVKNSPISFLPTKTTNEEKSHEKRDNTGSLDIKAIQATINDHRTMIEDNRVMITNIINNSINNNSVQQAISNHYTTTTPIWNSWRDLALIFVTFVIIGQLIYCCACHVKWRPCDYIVSRIFQRHNTRQSQKRKYPSTFPRSVIKTVEQDYADIHHSES